MTRPLPTYEFYAGVHGGRLGEAEFASALPEAAARARELVPADVPARLYRRYRHAVCALVDRVAGADERGLLRSETVGSTSRTYADADQGAAFGDADAVRPWLAGTGLMYRGLR